MSPMEAVARREKERPKLEVRAHLSVPNMGNTPPRMLLNEDAFVSMLYLERRRAERAQNRFVLILVDVQKLVNGISGKDRLVQMLAKSLSEATRETDIIGWYLENSLMGVIGTELGKATNEVVQKRLLDKLRNIFESTLGIEKSASLSVSFHFFPEEYGSGANDHSANIKLYPEIQKREDARRVPLAIKRAIDLAGSTAALIFLSPVFAAVAMAIKFSSKGPVLFKQERLGQHGKTFTVLKFRSMRTDCDAKIHQQYVEQFIAGHVDGNSEAAAKPVMPELLPISHNQALLNSGRMFNPSSWTIESAVEKIRDQYLKRRFRDLMGRPISEKDIASFRSTSVAARARRAQRTRWSAKQCMDVMAQA